MAGNLKKAIERIPERQQGTNSFYQKTILKGVGNWGPKPEQKAQGWGGEKVGRKEVVFHTTHVLGGVGDQHHPGGGSGWIMIF